MDFFGDLGSAPNTTTTQTSQQPSSSMDFFGDFGSIPTTNTATNTQPPSSQPSASMDFFGGFSSIPTTTNIANTTSNTTNENAPPVVSAANSFLSFDDFLGGPSSGIVNNILHFL